MAALSLGERGDLRNGKSASKRMHLKYFRFLAFLDRWQHLLHAQQTTPMLFVAFPVSFFQPISSMVKSFLFLSATKNPWKRVKIRFVLRKVAKNIQFKLARSLILFTHFQCAIVFFPFHENDKKSDFFCYHENFSWCNRNFIALQKWWFFYWRKLT